MTTAYDLLNTAVAHHTAGRFGDAERIYRHLIDAAPDDPNAYHLLGLVLGATGRPGMPLILRALAINPALADAWFNVGNLYRREGRLTDAAAALGRAAVLTPSPRNRMVAGDVLSEQAVALAGGLSPLKDASQVLHLRNRAEPQWRHDDLAARLGPGVRDTILALARESLRLAGRNANVIRRVAMLLVAAGELETALSVLEMPTDDGNPELIRLAAEIAWYLRKAEVARRHYEEFIHRRCEGEAPLRPLLPAVAALLSDRPAVEAEGAWPVLIYTHYGNPDYLHYSIGQALRSNPSARIVLIGDSDNRIEGVEHHTIRSSSSLTREVLELYRHDSNNAYCYELFCILRWFIFLEVSRKLGLEDMFFLDSDYMLFTGLREERRELRDAGVAFSLNSAHFSYFTIDKLAEFCAHIRAYFDSGEDTRSFHLRNSSDLFSNMALIHDYQRGHPWRNFCEIRDGTFFDCSLTNPAGFRSRNGVKDIWFDDGRPYGFHEKSGRSVHFRGLHFQGLSKPFMKEAFAGRGWGVAGPFAP